jgi:hypothetical protein
MKPGHNSGKGGHHYTSLCAGDMHLGSLISDMLEICGRIECVPQAFLTLGGPAATDMSVLWKG